MENMKNMENSVGSCVPRDRGETVGSRVPRDRDGWRKVRLGEICKSVSDGDHLAPPKSDTGVPFITISNIDDCNNIDFSRCMFVPQSYYDHVDAKRKAQPGDVLYSVVGSFGKPVLVREPKEFVFQRHIAILRPDQKIVDSRFLYSLMRTPEFYAQADSAAIGTAQRTISLSSLRSFEISLPPLPVQQRIAEILGAYDDAIENNRRRIALLEKMSRELYRERFVRRAGKDIARRTLGEIGIRLESGSRPKGGIQDIDDGIPSVGAENVIGLGQYNYDSEKLVSREFFAKMKRGVIRDRDILLYKDGAYIGRVSLFQDGFPHKEAAINEHVFLVHANDELLQYYIFFTLAQERYFKIMQGLNENAAQPGLNQGSVLGLKIEWPKREKIEAFNKLVEPMVAEIFSLALQNRNLARQRDRLLPRLMSGRLEVGA